MKKIVILLVTAMLLYMCSCGTDDIDISGYSDAEIALEGISDETAAVTVKQLKAMDCHTIKTESTSDKIGVVKPGKAISRWSRASTLNSRTPATILFSLWPM